MLLFFSINLVKVRQLWLRSNLKWHVNKIRGSNFEASQGTFPEFGRERCGLSSHTHTLCCRRKMNKVRERRTRKSTREVEMLKVLELQLPFPLYTLGQGEIFTRYGLYSLMQPLLLLATATLLPLAAATMLQQPIAAWDQWQALASQKS